MTNEAYHRAVLLHESVEALNIQPDGTYVDVTFGGGGHSRAILEKLDSGRLLAFDQDADAVANSQNSDFKDKPFELIRQNFRHMKRFLRLHGALPVDGILADLGISSHQIDTPERGFSTRFEGALDMRMDRSQSQSAYELVNVVGEAELVRIFSQFGEVRNSKRLAATIVAKRNEQAIETVGELKAIAGPLAIGNQNRYLAQVFQAIRIAVNAEMEVLSEFLQQSAACLKPGGRLVVITYHSLEDRPVKQFIAHGQFGREPLKDFYGKAIKPYEKVNKKPILATKAEIAENPRARSAKLRIGQRNDTSWPPEIEK